MAENGEIVITITLVPHAQGYTLNADIEPKDAFPDTIIDACHRTARFFEQRVQAAHVIQADEHARTKAQVSRMMGPGGKFLE